MTTMLLEIIFVAMAFTFCNGKDPCLSVGRCSQYCISTEDESFHCECAPEYMKDERDLTRCKSVYQDDRLKLLYANYTHIGLYIPPNDYSQQLFTASAPSKQITNFDLDYEGQMLFLSEENENEAQIYRAIINGNGSLSSSVIVKDDIKKVGGIAVDWIYKIIYWTDYDLHSIQLSNYNGMMRRTLFDAKSVNEPLHIAVDPIEGWIFWTTFSFDPKIERAGTDGSHHEIIASKNVEFPIEISLDLVVKQVYWVDTTLKMITACNYDGTNRRTIIENNHDNVIVPAGLTLFEDYIFWVALYPDDSVTYKANKFTVAHIEELGSAVSEPKSIKAAHKSRQPKRPNLCGPENGNCSHICLPAPQREKCSPNFICACPDGMELKSDGKICKKSLKGTKFHSKPVNQVGCGKPSANMDCLKRNDKLEILNALRITKELIVKEITALLDSRYNLTVKLNKF